VKYNNPAWINPALAVIKRADPALLTRMRESGWKVYAVGQNGEELLPLLPYTGFYFIATVASTVSKSYGVTLRDEPEIPPAAKNSTWLNRTAIEEQARESGFPVADFSAHILAHEFRHIEGGDESQARDAGTRFAWLMGSPAIAEFSESGRSEAVLDENRRQNFR
jgi:hypothetical protein